MKEKIIIALDVDTQEKALKIIEQTQEFVGYYKIGMGFLANNGIAFAESLVKKGYKIFLDLKLFDIGQTVSNAVQRLADKGFHMMTVHGDNYIVSAAVKGRALSENKSLEIYAVTLLTSLNEHDIHNAGYSGNIDDIILTRSKNAALAGADGVIASGHECRSIKSMGLSLKVITPGIRSEGVKTDDQQRVMTAQKALYAGADHLVIGREVIFADCPHTALQNIIHPPSDSLKISS